MQPYFFIRRKKIGDHFRWSTRPHSIQIIPLVWIIVTKTLHKTLVTRLYVSKIGFYKLFFRFFLFLFHSIPRTSTPVLRISTLIPPIPTLIPRIQTLIPRIPTLILCILTLIPAFPPWFPTFPPRFLAFPPWFPSLPPWFLSFPPWFPALPSFSSFRSPIPHSGFH